MIKRKQDIQWTVFEGDGQRAALRNYFEALTEEQRNALEVLWVERGRIVGYDDHEHVVAGFLYDADTGKLFEPTLENYLMIPIYSELHCGEALREDESIEEFNARASASKHDLEFMPIL